MKIIIEVTNGNVSCGIDYGVAPTNSEVACAIMRLEQVKLELLSHFQDDFRIDKT